MAERGSDGGVSLSASPIGVLKIDSFCHFVAVQRFRGRPGAERKIPLVQ